MCDTITIQERFVGPPEMGNGGYVCGRLAGHFDNAAKITLFKPARLNYPMQLRREASDLLHLYADDALIAEAAPDEFKLEIPQPPAVVDILEAQAQIEYGPGHPFPRCFVCGHERERQDGLRIFPVHMPGTEMVAAVWQPDASLVNEVGCVRPEYLWAALDCPGGFAAVYDRPRPVVLGQMRGRVWPGIRANESCIVIGWRIGTDGRKHSVGTALFTETGRRIGYAHAIWIELRH